MSLLKSFLVGSSYPVFLPFFYVVYNYLPKKNYTYYSYTLKSPLWFGLFNCLSLIIANKYNLSLRKRFFVISLMSFLLISFYAYYIKKSYNFTKKEWFKYFILVFVGHMFAWNLVIYNLEKYTSK